MRPVAVIMKPMLRMFVVVAVGSLALLGCSDTGTVSTSSTVVASPPPTSSAPQQTVTTATTATAPEATTPSCYSTEISQPPDTVLTFYAQCGSGPQVPYPIYRPGRTTPTLEHSVAALLAGTTPAETALGLYAGFDAVEEADQVGVNASIDVDGTAHIQLLLEGTHWVPETGEWTSDQLNSLLDPLLATVFASGGVTGLDMTTLCFEQIACDGIVTRAEWAGILFTNTGALLHRGCTPELAWRYPDLCTLDGVLSQPIAAGTVANVADDDTLNVRAGPGIEFFIHGELAPGATLSVTKEAAIATDGGIWRLIDSPQSGAGWVNQAFLDITRSPAETLVDAFVNFAHDPTDGSFAELPLAENVDLGLGPTIIKTVTADELRQPETWRLDVKDFRASTGPFSAFNALGRSDIYDITIGEHAHCASPPVPPPDGYEDLDRVSVQPRQGLRSGCLEWTTVDFFLGPNGDVAAITLDIWEP